MFVSKKMAAIFAVFALFLFSSVSQSKNQSSNQISNDSQSTQSVQGTQIGQNSGNPADEVSSEVPFYINSNSSSLEEPSRFSTFFIFLRMLLVLAFVVGCIYAVMWFLKRSMKVNPNNSDPFLRKVSSVDLAPGKSVHVVTLLDHAYVVGVSDNAVNLIGELSSKDEKDDELIKAMNLYSDEHQNVKKPRSFADVLEIFMPGGARDKNGIFSDVQKKMDRNLKSQRDEINGGGQ